ncbi:MAG: hypothetical protein ACI809_002971, partial [Candidatus Azotimanducaceae bacterium]
QNILLTAIHYEGHFRHGLFLGCRATILGTRWSIFHSSRLQGRITPN